MSKKRVHPDWEDAEIEGGDTVGEGKISGSGTGVVDQDYRRESGSEVATDGGVTVPEGEDLENYSRVEDLVRSYNTAQRVEKEDGETEFYTGASLREVVEGSELGPAEAEALLESRTGEGGGEFDKRIEYGDDVLYVLDPAEHVEPTAVEDSTADHQGKAAH